MRVDVDQPGSDIEPGDVHRLPGLPRGNALRHSRYLIAADCNVHHPIDAIGGIDHVAALEQQVVSLGGEQPCGDQARQ